MFKEQQKSQNGVLNKKNDGGKWGQRGIVEAKMNEAGTLHVSYKPK